MKIRISKQKQKYNKGSGLGVILFGVTLLLVLLFTAVNIVNSKVIEGGYASLRDAVQSASVGSVIHILKTERDNATQAQKDVISGTNGKPKYDIYLQLALGYLINYTPNDRTDETEIQTGEINNFLKLDHQKVVNTTMALLDDVTVRSADINTSKYKIMMFFIEPYRDANNKKFFNIIAYGNKDYGPDPEMAGKMNIRRSFATGIVDSGSNRKMRSVYNDIEACINSMVNCTYGGMFDDDKNFYSTDGQFAINLNTQGSDDVSGLIRDMETYPHYLIVVKDFALPTIFNQDTYEVDANGIVTERNNIIRSIFTDLTGDGTLSSPMCALNTGKIQRQSEDKGWGQDLKH